MNVDEVNAIIRNMAKSSKWQSIYTSAKEIKLKIFENEIDLTEFQLLFLNYLAFYSSLYLDIAMGDVEDFVMDNFIYEDSYMLYRRKNKNKDIDKPEPIKGDKSKVSNRIGWVFKRPIKKVSK